MISSDSPAERTGAGTEDENRRSRVVVQTRLFPLEVIMSTAHRFSGRFHVGVQAVGDGVVEVELKARDGGSCDGIADSFQNELLDDRLRGMVAEKSRRERDLILAHALSRHPVLHAEYESAAAFSDPQELLKPDAR